MAIKVIGTGAPRMLTVRFRPCEVAVLLDELHHQRAVITEAAAHAHATRTAPGAGSLERAFGPTSPLASSRNGCSPAVAAGTTGSRQGSRGAPRRSRGQRRNRLKRREALPGIGCPGNVWVFGWVLATDLALSEGRGGAHHRTKN
jgi:hypothetical protein